MKRINYKEKKFLNEESTQEQAEFCVEQTKLELQSDILATKKSLSEAEFKLEGFKTEYPLPINSIIDLQMEIEGLKKGLKCLENIQKELGL